MEFNTPASAKIYSKLVLSVYDLWVLKISNRFFWKCPTSEQLKYFEQFYSDNHLDIGVGTGYYLKHNSETQLGRRLALMDINRNSLTVAEKTLSHYKPEIYIQDILKPISQPIQPFSSVSISYLLHCLSGPFNKKELVFRHIKEILEPGGILFCSTIVNQGDFNLLATRLMKTYNQKGIFGNLEDTKQNLETTLHQHFSWVQIKMVGHVALFAAK